jgi:threonine aldolase
VNVDGRGFASDNNAGAHPEVLDAIVRANVGHASGYGADEWTRRAEEAIREALGLPDAAVALVFNGTGANVLALSALLDPWQAVVCAATAHIEQDECGAPERFLGVKLVDVATEHGKLTPELIGRATADLDDPPHRVAPGVVSITQSTELGTVYTASELEALVAYAHGRGLAVHVDGARLANAAVALGTSLGEACRGADVVTLGGTKNGLLFGEAVVFADPRRATGVPFLRKQTMQLASKMRFLGAQFEALLGDDLWRRSAAQANAMAGRLAASLAGLPGVELAHPVEANEVFVRLPLAGIEDVQAVAPFYVWDAADSVVRFVCSWDTTPTDVDALVDAVARR